MKRYTKRFGNSYVPAGATESVPKTAEQFNNNLRAVVECIVRLGQIEDEQERLEDSAENAFCHKPFDIFASGWAGRLRLAFPRCYINMDNELIIHPGRNSYFLLSDIKNEIELKAKILEWLSREAFKAGSKATQRYHLSGINEALGTDFDTDAIEFIYTYLGNAVNHRLTLQFIGSGYDPGVLPADWRQR